MRKLIISISLLFGILYNSTAQNTGIGTTTPLTPLHIIGNTRVDTGRLSFVNTAKTVYIGDSAGKSDPLTGNTRNTAVGYKSLYSVSTGAGNSALGYRALINNTGNSNTAIGFDAMYSNTTGYFNTVIGQSALSSSQTAYYNTVIGGQALLDFIDGSENVAIGMEALTGLTNGNDNTAVGSRAGYNNLSGSGNVFIGSNAGFNEAGSNRLYISNSTTNSPLLYGEFDTKKLVINDSLESKYFKMTNGAANGYVLQTDAAGNASWVAPSAGSVQWTLSGTDIYNSNSGNVGIGTSSPSSLLHVSGSSVISTLEATSANAYFSIKSPLSNEAAIRLGTASSLRWLAGKTNGAETGSNQGSDFFINRYDDAGSFAGQPFIIKRATGNIGIGGIGNPAQKVDVSGSINVSATNGYYIGNIRVLGTGNTSSGNLFIGQQAGQSETENNKLYIDNSNTSSPLIYGDFTNNKIIINDSLQSRYFKMTNGATSGYLFQSDATGNANWVNPATVKTGTLSLIADADANTKVETEQSVNENQIRFILNGNERFKMNKGILEVMNGSNSIYIGTSAGDADDYSIPLHNVGVGNNALQNATMGGYYNTAIGKSALHSVSTGNRNTAVGTHALYSTNGSTNTALGFYAGASNSGSSNVFIGNEAGMGNGGSSNVFIGNGAGSNETGSSKLYIDNNSASSPLIYGDFSKDSMAVNGSLMIQGAMGLKVKTGQVAGTNNPNATGAIWMYSSGTGAIDLTAAAYTDRLVIILNNTGAARSISSYRDLSNTAQTTIANNTSLWIVYDGTNWRQIK